ELLRVRLVHLVLELAFASTVGPINDPSIYPVQPSGTYLRTVSPPPSELRLPGNTCNTFLPPCDFLLILYISNHILFHPSSVAIFFFYVCPSVLCSVQARSDLSSTVHGHFWYHAREPRVIGALCVKNTLRPETMNQDLSMAGRWRNTELPTQITPPPLDRGTRRGKLRDLRARLADDVILRRALE
ncbi:hypothetical protein CVT26_011300, partial [Gymnopilus dilepis]